MRCPRASPGDVHPAALAVCAHDLLRHTVARTKLDRGHAGSATTPPQTTAGYAAYSRQRAVDAVRMLDRTG